MKTSFSTSTSGLHLLALFLLSASLALPCRADDAAPVAVTTNADGSTNTWTMADLVTALQLMNRKYHRDVATESGRVSWHGRLVSQEVDTNALVKVCTYADGTEFRDPWTTITASSAAAAAKAAALSVTTNGIPARLAAARLRRATEKAAQSNVTVIVQAKIEAEQAAAIAAAIAEAQAAAQEAEAVGRDVPDAPSDSAAQASDALH